MHNLRWIIQPCFISKRHHQGRMRVWVKGHLGAKFMKIVAIFNYRGARSQILSSVAPKGKRNQLLSCVMYVSIVHGITCFTKVSVVKIS